MNFCDEVHKEGGEELDTEFAFAGRLLSFFQQSLVPVLLGVQSRRIISQRGGGIASWSLRGGGRRRCFNSNRGGGTSARHKRRDVWVESSLLLPFIATGRHDKSDGVDFFLLEKRG